MNTAYLKPNPCSLTPVLQQDAAHTGKVLAGMVQTGLLQHLDNIYLLANDLGPRTGRRKIAPAEAILNYVQAYGRVSRREAIVLTVLSDGEVRYLLRKLVEGGDLEQAGSGRSSYYRTPEQREQA